ncbi:hypothetical protein F5Y06DRAFT_308543 [Hypoxylon sp. FL0890]|nr:hypothetical protein F5Y06DRAFT_308543 [Hypoxylon sp. FL0890]
MDPDVDIFIIDRLTLLSIERHPIGVEGGREGEEKRCQPPKLGNHLERLRARVNDEGGVIFRSGKHGMVTTVRVSALSYVAHQVLSEAWRKHMRTDPSEVTCQSSIREGLDARDWSLRQYGPPPSAAWRRKLCDFGVAGMVKTKLDNRSSFVGTPHWMAPDGTEVYIWALGSMVYEIASELCQTSGSA